MKRLGVLLIALFAANAYAETIACTTRFVNERIGKPPNEKLCGAVRVDRVSDNGVKYRKQPRFCKNIDVDFFSIREGDAPKFSKFCQTISARQCYMVGIRDKEFHQGIGGLSSFMVFPGIASVPSAFNLNATGYGHHTGPIVGVGRFVRLDLSCRKRR
ncbi:MAG: hypothetical protein P8Y71_26515 [Pseudolabrys sp.]